MITVSTDLIFLAIIFVYALIGAQKGFIKSVGGLIAMVLSWIISRAAAMPVTIELFKNFNLEAKITEFMSMLNSGFAETNTILNSSINIPFLPINQLTGTINGIFNTTALNIGSMLVAIVLFAVCMLLFGVIVKLAQAAFEKIPMGKTMNSVFGLVCGSVKGLILTVIIFMLISVINSIFQLNIPISECFIGRMMMYIGSIHF